MFAHGGSGGCFGGGWCGWMDIVDEFSCGIAPPDLALGYRQAALRARGWLHDSLPPHIRRRGQSSPTHNRRRTVAMGPASGAVPAFHGHFFVISCLARETHSSPPSGAWVWSLN